MAPEFNLPPFPETTQWLSPARNAAERVNTATIKRETQGRPTLVHFWSVSSEASKTNLAHIVALRDQCKREGLRVIAVHVPQFEREKDAKLVVEAMARLNITEPCAVDDSRKLCAAFQNHEAIVPAYYLFEPNGRLRSRAIEEDGLAAMEDALDQMLFELRINYPFCPACERYLDKDALFCADCGLPLLLPGSRGTHPYYENHHAGSLPTVRLVNPDPLIGRVIDGKYKLNACLGQGGMATVYRAGRVHIGDEVAVKILLPKYVSDEVALARFRREARAAAMLHHPNVITIHDFGETDDADARAYIVMEYIKGTQLRELLSSGDHFSVERAARLMRGICAGVGAAHRQGVVHRDLKPENILVLAPNEDFEFESVKVVDFGLAKLLDRGESSTAHKITVVGTPFYMSPEQCLGEPADARSDVYSLGAMLYEMIAGKTPFSAVTSEEQGSDLRESKETVSGIISKHLYEAPPPLPPELAVPRRISNAIMQALAKNPADRPQTASEFGRLLQISTGAF